MENLSKENFWNELSEKYPQAVELFNNWIDKYQKEVGWGDLFPNGVKFHDLPFEMQNGILARFDIECFHGVLTGKGKAVYESERSVYVQGFINLFRGVQIMLEKQKQ
jgi:hypothetical protein